ncbi:MAG: DotA/TraY family protein [Candidatus Competibacteraceae bacterium]|nr:DotA/TraY family protein [Candidatus Competibacteraceae bacterium]
MASQLARNTLNALSCVESVNRVESTPGGYPPLGVSTKEEEPKKGIWASVKDFFSGEPKGAQYNDLINAAAAKYGMPASFIHAIIQAESGYNPNALSPKGATGLMQLMPDTAKRFGVTNARDPAQNIDGGTHYLRWLYDRFGGDLKLVAAGYNAGEGAVQRYGNTIPPYSETRNYVSKVMNNYQKNGGGTPGEVAGTSLRHYLFGGGKYAADLCGDIPLPVRTVTENTDFNGVQTAMRNDIQAKHVEAYETLLNGLRDVIAQLQAGDEKAAAEQYARLVQDYANTVYQAGIDAYQSRQAEMIAQWKESARKDGWATGGMWFWQLADANIAVTTAINEMLPEQKGPQPELNSLSKETADQVRLALTRNDAIINALQTASVAGTEAFASWRATSDVAASFNYAVPAGGRAFDQASENDKYKILSSQLQEAFRWLQPAETNEFPLLTWYRFGHTLMTVGAGTMVSGAVAGIASTAAGLMISALGGAVFGMGWLLSLYMAYLPLLIWLAQFLAWLLLAVIAAFGMPLWMLMHLSGEGEGISGARGQSGYGLLLSLLLKPVLLVFGLFAAISLIYILGWFINATIGTTLKNPPNSVFECVGLIAVYVLAVVSFGTLCLRIISMIPEMAFLWIDIRVGSSFVGSALESAEGGLRGGGRALGNGGGPLAKTTGEMGHRTRNRNEKAQQK